MLTFIRILIETYRIATKYGSTLIQQIYKKIIVVVIINHLNTIVNTTPYDDRTSAGNEIIHYNQVNFFFEFIIFFLLLYLLIN
jgi:hypothetical protein